MISDAERNEWLLDPSRDQFRILLLELNHADGTIYLGSAAWVSNHAQPYHNGIISLPDMESDLDSFAGFGGFDVKDETGGSNWFDYSWYGHTCRWLYGDKTWPRDQFFSIGESVIQQCLSQGNDVYSFDLMDAGLKLRKQLASEDTTRTETVSEFAAWVSLETGVAISFVNVPSSKLALNLEVELSTITTAAVVIREIARDINAELRYDLLGNVEIFVPQSETTSIGSDIIATNRLEAIDVEPPYSRIEVTMNDGTVIGTDTGADIGLLENVLKITTHLTNITDVNTLLQELTMKYATHRNIFGVPVKILGDALIVGGRVNINHSDLTRDGLIRRIVKQPLSSYTMLEVEV